MTQRNRIYTITSRNGEQLEIFDTEEVMCSYNYDHETDTLYVTEKMNDESIKNFVFFRPINISIEWDSDLDEKLK